MILSSAKLVKLVTILYLLPIRFFLKLLIELNDCSSIIALITYAVDIKYEVHIFNRNVNIYEE